MHQNWYSLKISYKIEYSFLQELHHKFCFGLGGLHLFVNERLLVTCVPQESQAKIPKMYFHDVIIEKAYFLQIV